MEMRKKKKKIETVDLLEKGQAEYVSNTVMRLSLIHIFWLTTGHFSDQFEKEFAEWIGVKYAHLVNSGSSANLIAFTILTAPELGDRDRKSVV